jgi:hypothetical protein
MADAGGAPAGAAPVVVPPRPYALTPALLEARYLDYSVVNDIKLYYKAVKPLSVKFDLSGDNMREFLNVFYCRAKDVNWLMTLTVPVGAVNYDLIRQYGSITLLEVRAYASTYVGTQSRHAQNSNQIYACLIESLTTEARNRVVLETENYTVTDELDGLLFFKVIVGLAHIDTRATITVIRTRLSSLDVKIADFQDNIVDLNAYVKNQTDSLHARGETTNDLLVNLFKAYKVCSDEEFVGWAKRKEDNYNEGFDIAPTELMNLANNKYKTQTESGTWMQKSKAQKRIVALTAQISSMEKSKSLTKPKPEAKKTPHDSKGKGNGKAYAKKGGRDKEYDWILVGPTTGQPTEKDVNGKHFRWCTYHDHKGSGGKWVQHTLQACKVRQELEAKKQHKADSAAGQMKVAGMVTVIEEDDDY